MDWQSVLTVGSLWTGLFPVHIHRVESAWASRVIFKTLLNGAKSVIRDTAVSTLLFTEPRATRWRRIYAPCVTHGYFILGWTTRDVTTEPLRVHTQHLQNTWRNSGFLFGKHPAQTSLLMIFGFSDRDCSPLQTKTKYCIKFRSPFVKGWVVAWRDRAG
jgi:hypothetical protein